MKILNFGSLNYDHVYEMHHFVQPKETTASLSYQKHLGGKGLNQTIALVRAGCEVYHAGKVGNDGREMIDFLKNEGVKVDCLLQDECETTGHAIIEVCQGENCIILHGGANQSITEKDVDFVLSYFEKGDVLLLQNEISSMAYLIEQAHQKGMWIAMNTAPMNEKVFEYPLEKINLLVVNEVEAKALACSKSDDYLSILRSLATAYPEAEIVMTLGKDGCYYHSSEEDIYQEAFQVNAIDTTAAGDTFLGYFLASYLQKEGIRQALRKACFASSLSVQRHGAAPSIPYAKEINQ